MRIETPRLCPRGWTYLMVAYLMGCTPADPQIPAAGSSEDAEQAIELRVYELSDGPPPGSEATLVYLRGLAEAHEEADQAGSLAEGLRPLELAFAKPVPKELELAVALRLELGARICETRIQLGAPERCADTLSDMLSPAKPLPLRKESARALVAWGDAHYLEGDLDTAADAYARAVELMGLMVDKLEGVAR